MEMHLPVDKVSMKLEILVGKIMSVRANKDNNGDWAIQEKKGIEQTIAWIHPTGLELYK